jgi:hypothetical protein
MSVNQNENEAESIAGNLPGFRRRTPGPPPFSSMNSGPASEGREQPSDPHHLRFAQPRALGLKVSDEFTVPLCRDHHRQVHPRKTSAVGL